MKIDFTDEGLWNEAYMEMFEDTDKRFVVCKGARASGKSRHIAQYLVVASYMEEGLGILCLRLNYSDLRASVFEEIVQVIKDWGLEDDFDLPNGPKAGLYIENNKTGSFFRFKGVKEKVKSLSNIALCFVEEADEISRNEFQELVPSIRGRSDLFPNTRVILAFNPPSKKHWLYDEFFSPTPYTSREKSILIETTFSDNKFPYEEDKRQDIIDLLESFRYSNPQYYQRYCLGEWIDYDDQLIFPSAHFGPIPKGMVPVRYGWDYGFSNDPSVLVEIYHDPEQNIIYINELFRVNGKTIAEQIQIMESMQLSKIIPMSCEHMPEGVELFKRAGYRAEKATDKSIENGLTRMKEFNLVINEQNVKLTEEFSLYHYKDNGKAVDMWNHGIDAARYAITDEFGSKANELRMKGSKPTFFWVDM